MTSSQNENPGEVFRVSREKLGLTIGDVSVATKINARILKALEDGDREGLPANSFARGFIRSYASYLKIESQPILDAYNLVDGVANPNINTDMDIPAATTAAAPAPEPKTSESKKELHLLGDSSIASKAFLVGGLVLIIALVVGIKGLFDKYAQERIIDPVLVTEDTAADEKVSEKASDNATIKAEPENTADVEPKVTEKITENETKPEEESLAAAPTQENLTEKPTVDQKPEPPAPPPPPAPEPKSKTPVATSQPQEVILEALDTVEVTVVIDGNETKKIKLKPEAVHTIKAKASIELDIQDGGMVNIIHNGRDRGVPGDLGKSAKVKFP